jgi:hypothetical protein
VTNTTGATWIAGRDCSALISLSDPTAEAAAVDRPQTPAASRCPRERSSEASLVATPLHAKPRPAPTIVIAASGLPTIRSRYGVMLATPRPTSTSVSVRSPAWVVVRPGAVSAAPVTPSTIAPIATYSRRPACSPSSRWPTNISTSSPAASAGCTTTSGASSSAITCSGQPRIERPVPSSQRARRISFQASASRRCSSWGASRASRAWKATPRL